MSKKQVSRRDFLRRSAVAAAGAGAAISGVGAGCGWAQVKKENIPKRVLGRTGLKVTELSFGGTRLGDRAVLNYGIDRGINFIHAHPGYNRGKAFPEFCAVVKERRNEVVFGMKLLEDELSEERLDDILGDLGIEYTDILAPGIHTVEEIASPALKDFLLAMKQKGKAKSIGFAVHRNEPDVLARAVELEYFDLVLLAYNASNLAQLDPIVEKMEKIGMGFVAMKTLKGLQRASEQDREKAVKSALNNPKVDTVIRGFTTKDEVDTFINWTLTRTAGVAPDDRRRLAAKMAGVNCTMCGNCGICPRNVAVCDIFRFQYYAEDGQLDVARDEYAALPASQCVGACDLCGLCEEVCSNNIPIRQRLQEVHSLLA
ncbi:MAG: aldo/keto reductase [Armatimonadota bacterium]|jgi:hypothetical protein